MNLMPAFHWGDPVTDLEQQPPGYWGAISIPGPVCWQSSGHGSLVGHLSLQADSQCVLRRFLDHQSLFQGMLVLRRRRGYSCATFDKVFQPGKRTLDFLSPAGFALLVLIEAPCEVILCWKPLHARL